METNSFRLVSFSLIWIVFYCVLCGLLIATIMLFKSHISKFVFKIQNRGLIENSLSGIISNTLNFRLFEPLKVKEKSSLLIILHGSTERGSDNKRQLTLGNLSLIKEITKKYNCYVLIPQCPLNKAWTINPSKPFNNFNLANIPESKLIKDLALYIPVLITTYNIDAKRIYITGHSMGATGAWEFILRYPELFAAAVPVCGASDPSHVENCKNISVWAFSGENDEIYDFNETTETISCLQKVTIKDAKHTILKNQDHRIWPRAVNNKNVLDWIFKQHK